MPNAGLWVTLGLNNLFSGKAKEVSSSLKDVDKNADQTVKGFQRLQNAMTAVASAKVFQKAKESFGEIVGSAQNFDAAMALVNSRISDSSVNLKDVENQILKISSTSGIESTELANQVMNLLEGGIPDVKTALDLLPETIKLAQANAIDLGSAVNTVLDAANSFGVPADKLKQLTNQIQITSTAGTLGINALRAAYARIGPLAESLGVTFTEFNASISILATQGVSGRNSIKALNSSMESLLNHEKELQPFVKKAGFKTLEDMIGSRGLVSTLDSLFSSLDNNREKLAEFGFRGSTLSTLFRLTGDNIKRTAGAVKEMGADTTTLASQHEKATNNMKHHWEVVANQFENIKKRVGKSLGEALTPLIEKMTEWLTTINEFVQENPKFVQAVGIMIGVMTALTAVFAGLAAINFVGLPITAIFLGVALVVTGVILAIKNWGAVVEWLGKTWSEVLNGMKIFFSTIWGSIIGVFHSAMNGFGAFFTAKWNTLSSFFKGIWSGISSFFKGIWSGISSFFSGVISFVQGLWAGLVDYLSSAWNSWAGNFRDVTQIISDVLSGVGTAAFEIFNSMFIEPIKTIISYVQQAIQWISNLGQAMQETLSTISLPSFITDAFTSVGDLSLNKQEKPAPKGMMGGRLLPSGTPAANPLPVTLPSRRSEMQQNINQSSARNPAVQAPIKQAPTNVVVNVPQSKITAAPIILDSNKISQAVFEMTKQQTVRATL